MFVISEKNARPVKIWQSGAEVLDAKCIEQAQHLSQLPFAYKWIALMPDTHAGMGIPIGGVIACENVVVPNAVGVDIGCGMGFVQTNIPVSVLRETVTGSGNLVQGICGDILRNIPTAFSHYQKPQASAVLDRAKTEMQKYEADAQLIPQLDEGYFHTIIHVITAVLGMSPVSEAETSDGRIDMMIEYPNLLKKS